MLDGSRWGKVVVDCPGWVEMSHVGDRLWQMALDGLGWGKIVVDNPRWVEMSHVGR